MQNSIYNENHKIQGMKSGFVDTQVPRLTIHEQRPRERGGEGEEERTTKRIGWVYRSQTGEGKQNVQTPLPGRTFNSKRAMGRSYSADRSKVLPYHVARRAEDRVEMLMRAYRITQRQPGLRSLLSRPWLYCAFAPLASSSSTTSCGLTVICTTLGASWLNFDSGSCKYQYL